ncbi:response regulator [Shimia aestuarii]|uniref:Response regulator receiver domain-containing protein n=1 Tax=Shimia aestuarii TaxID=254406 RepID=A0A1I4PU30_9RHOB|nr:response regulator [Shimia aestuarii]SFM31000.1 Response regulator receiver domain-containing protein [Shimia aestuarii]
MKILIVDDDPDILSILSASLEAFGHQDIDTATSGADALELLETASRPYSLFLLDIQMPIMTGVELCALIRSMPEYHFTPIIMVTAMSGKSHVDAAFAAGATDYITKPFQFEDIKLRISLAERASFQAEQLDRNAVAHAAEDTSHGDLPKLALEDALPINDVDGVLRVHAFENYLAQMGRLEFSRTRLEILTVTNIVDIYERCTSHEFCDQITDIAECISDAMRHHAPMIAYFGGGIFGIAITGRLAGLVEDHSTDIRNQIEEVGLVYRDGTPVLVMFELFEVSKRAFVSPRRQVDFIERITRDLKLAAHTGTG